jgi:dephospho-CoA kinase
MLIGITGKIGSGKSTAASYLQKQHDLMEYSMAGPLKKIGAAFGFTQEQLYGTQEQKLQIHPYWGISSREFLQKVGTELFREQLPKVLPNMKIKRTIWCEIFRLDCQTHDYGVVVSDVRFLDEVDTIHEMGGTVIRIVRPGLDESSTHRSELEMDSIKADYTIVNDGTLNDLYSRLDTCIEEIEAKSSRPPASQR